jgi:proline iminopeptidase
MSETSRPAYFRNAVLLFVSCLLFCVTAPSARPAARQLRHPPGDFVRVNGKNIWYESEGEGEPLLLIAGGPGFSHAYFHPYFSALADSHRVIYFDAYGCGKSERAESPGAYSLAGAVEDVEGLRKALKLEKVNVLGHSYGGFVAQGYAVKYPNSLRRLVLANTVASGPELQIAQTRYNDELRDQLPELWAKVRRLRARGVRSSAKEFQEAYGVPPVFHYFYNPENARQLPITEPSLYNPDLWYAMAGDDADFIVGGELARYDVRPRLRRLRKPVLVLAGRFDRNTFPRLTFRYKNYLPHAEFVVLEKSGHFPFIEEAEKSVAALRTFLAR